MTALGSAPGDARSPTSLAQMLASRSRAFAPHAQPEPGMAPAFVAHPLPRPPEPADAGLARTDRPVDPPRADPDDDGGQTPGDAASLAWARADGFAAGLAEGQRRADADLGFGLADLDRLARALADAVADARSIDPSTLAPQLAETVLALLAAVLDADPALARVGLEARARRALAELGEDMPPATLWLAPADADHLGPTLARAGLTLTPDPTLAPGAFRLTTARSRLDDNPDARLGRLAPQVAEATALAASTLAVPNLATVSLAPGALAGNGPTYDRPAAERELELPPHRRPVAFGEPSGDRCAAPVDHPTSDPERGGDDRALRPVARAA